MATLTVSSADADTGLNTTDGLTAAAAGGDVFANDGNTMFIVDNASGGALTVTFVTQATAGRNAMAVADVAVSVGAAKNYIFGPFEAGMFNNSSGQVAVTYSGVTSLTVLPVKLTY